MRPLNPPQLRRLLLRRISASLSSSPSSSSPPLQAHTLSRSTKPTRHFHSTRPATTTASSHFLPLPHFSLSRRPFSSASPPTEDSDQSELARSLSAELLKDPASDPLSAVQRLQLSFSHVAPTQALIQSVLNSSPDAGRAVLGFNSWLVANPNFSHTDETLSYFVDYLGRRKDFKATHDVIVGAGVAGPKTFASAIDRLVRAGRAGQAVSLFEKMEADYGLKRDKAGLRLVVEKLCESGFASHAEKMVKSLAGEFFPDEHICDLLIRGWCVDGKLEEARRLAGEMYRGGFEIGTLAYNAILDCVCKLCRDKDPFRIHAEVEEILVDMDTHGVPRNAETFNVLIANLCKIRKTEDALSLFRRMGEWGCRGNEATFLVLIRSLYQAARVGEGDEMIDMMKSAGFGGALDKKAYYGFLKILCGVERVDHAMRVFKKMKEEDKCEPGVKTYELLMHKLYAHNRVDRASALFNEAQKRGVPLTHKEYPVDPRFLKKKKREAVKTEKKRETFPEKMARKRRRLKQIRLSFVKKPKKSMRRAY